MNNTSDKKKKPIVLIGIAVILAMAVFVCWASFKPAALKNYKVISVSVRHGDDTDTKRTYHTREDTLGGLLTEDGLIELETRGDAAYITVVDGEAAAIEDGVYWLYMVNGDPPEDYDIEAREIADGDSYTFYLYSIN